MSSTVNAILQMAAAVAGLVLAVAGCDGGSASRPPEVTVSTPRGGVVRFSGALLGDVMIAAQTHCHTLSMHAVPIGFFTIGKDAAGRDRAMTFQCVS